MKRVFVLPVNFVAAVVRFNEIKLVKEDDVGNKERRSKNIGAKEVGGQGQETFKAL